MFERKATGVTLEADGTIRVVELTATIRTIALSRMQAFAPVDEDPFSSWGMALQKAREAGFDVDSCVAGITDSLTYRKVLNFPFRSRKRINQILESELEGEIPVPSETVVADFLPGAPVEKGLGGIAFACPKRTMTAVMEIFGGGGKLRGIQTISTGLLAACNFAGFRTGIAVMAMAHEALLLEMRSGSLAAVRRISITGDFAQDSQSIATGIMEMAGEEDDIILACPDELSSALEAFPGMDAWKSRRFADLPLAGLIHGTAEEIAEFEIGLGLALRALGRRESIALDLRQGPFGQISPLANLKGPLKRTAAIGVVVILLLIAGLAVNTSKAKRDFERFSGQLETEFKEQFPEVKYRKGVEVNLAQEQFEKLQGKVSDLSGFNGTGVLTVLARLSSAVPAQINMKIDELSFDSNKLRIDGTVSSFDAVEKVKKALDDEPFFTKVQVQNARLGADVNRINFRLQMEVQ